MKNFLIIALSAFIFFYGIELIENDKNEIASGESIQDYIVKVNQDGKYELTKNGITLVYDNENRTVIDIKASKKTNKIVVPSSIGNYKIDRVESIDYEIGNDCDFTLELSEGIEEIGEKLFSGTYMEWHNEHQVTLILPKSIEKIESKLVGVNIVNIPSKEVFIKYPEYTANKIASNLYYIEDYSYYFWDYSPASLSSMHNEVSLVRNEIDEYVYEAKKYAEKNPNESVVCYIRVSNKYTDSVFADDIFEKTESYDENKEYSKQNITVYFSMFSNNDDLKKLAEAVVYYIRHPETYDGNGGIFPKHDQREKISLYVPFYDEDVIASGKLMEYVYDTDTSKQILYTRYYPGEI